MDQRHQLPAPWVRCGSTRHGRPELRPGRQGLVGPEGRSIRGLDQAPIRLSGKGGVVVEVVDGTDGWPALIGGQIALGDPGGLVAAEMAGAELGKDDRFAQGVAIGTRQVAQGRQRLLEQPLEGCPRDVTPVERGDADVVDVAIARVEVLVAGLVAGAAALEGAPQEPDVAGADRAEDRDDVTPGRDEPARAVVEVAQRPGEPRPVHLVGEAHDDRSAERLGGPGPGTDVGVVLAGGDVAMALVPTARGVRRVGRLPVDDRRHTTGAQAARQLARESARAQPLDAAPTPAAVPPGAPQRPGGRAGTDLSGEGVERGEVRALAEETRARSDLALRRAPLRTD